MHDGDLVIPGRARELAERPEPLRGHGLIVSRVAELRQAR